MSHRRLLRLQVTASQNSFSHHCQNVLTSDMHHIVLEDGKKGIICSSQTAMLVSPTFFKLLSNFDPSFPHMTQSHLPIQKGVLRWKGNWDSLSLIERKLTVLSTLSIINCVQFCCFGNPKPAWVLCWWLFSSVSVMVAFFFISFLQSLPSPIWMSMTLALPWRLQSCPIVFSKMPEQMVPTALKLSLLAARQVKVVEATVDRQS